MSPLEIRAHLTAVPFRPFRITTTRTGSYEVVSPANVLVSTTSLYVGSDLDADGLPQQVHHLPLAQVTRVQTL